MTALERLPAMELGARAAQRRSRGVEMLDIRGVPVLDMPPHIVDAVVRTVHDPRPRLSRGWPELRAAIASHLRAAQHVNVDPDTDILVTHGAQQGMSIALRALLETGDEVLVPAPTYFFDGMIRLAGAVPVYVQTHEADGWRIDSEALRERIGPRTRAILLCNPNNPTGTVPSRTDLARIVALAQEHGLLVLSDESYEGYVHEGSYTPLQSFRGAHDGLVTVTSFSKDYAFTNWRVGYVVAPEALLARIHAAFEWDAINVGDAPQAAAAAAMEGPKDWLEPDFSTMRERRDLLHGLLIDGGIGSVRPAAGIFLLARVDPSGRLRGRALEDALLDQGVTALAGDAFRGPAEYVRLLFGGTSDTIRRTVAALLRVSSATQD